MDCQHSSYLGANLQTFNIHVSTKARLAVGSAGPANSYCHAPGCIAPPPRAECSCRQTLFKIAAWGLHCLLFCTWEQIIDTEISSVTPEWVKHASQTTARLEGSIGKFHASTGRTQSKIALNSKKTTIRCIHLDKMLGNKKRVNYFENEIFLDNNILLCI